MKRYQIYRLCRHDKFSDVYLTWFERGRPSSEDQTNSLDDPRWLGVSYVHNIYIYILYNPKDGVLLQQPEVCSCFTWYIYIYLLVSLLLLPPYWCYFFFLSRAISMESANALSFLKKPQTSASLRKCKMIKCKESPILNYARFIHTTTVLLIPSTLLSIFRRSKKEKKKPSLDGPCKNRCEITLLQKP